MDTQPTTQLIQWQDFKVLSEADLVLKRAQQCGWKDCKIFGHGNMLTQPLESMGWKLIPADLYEYSIPAEGVNRILQIVNAGIHIQGVVIADDTRGTRLLPPPTKRVVKLPLTKVILSLASKVLRGLAAIAGAALIGAIAFSGFALLGVILVKGLVILLPLLLLCSAVAFDPQLIILVDDGNDGLAWISILTWYD